MLWKYEILRRQKCGHMEGKFLHVFNYVVVIRTIGYNSRLNTLLTA